MVFLFYDAGVCVCFFLREPMWLIDRKSVV